LAKHLALDGFTSLDFQTHPQQLDIGGSGGLLNIFSCEQQNWPGTTYD